MGCFPQSAIRGCPLGSAQSFCSPLHSFKYLQIPRASTEIAAQRFLDLFAGRRGVRVEERARREEKTGRAITALCRAELGECVLERVERSAPRHSLDGLDAPVRVGDGQRETGQDRGAVDEHGARAALAQLAAVLGAREVELFAEDLEQRFLWCKGDLHALPVDGEGGVCLLLGEPLDRDRLSGHDAGCLEERTSASVRRYQRERTSARLQRLRQKKRAD